MRINVARTLPRSAANGPGERFVLWVQGCPLACAGCWNPDTWSFARRATRTVDDLFEEITAIPDLQGVTFTGGEPFAQARALAALAERLRATGRSIVVFTGYDRDELTRPDHRALLAATDVLIAGRYVEALRAPGLGLRGSSNQTVHRLTDRYRAADLDALPEVEVHLLPDGSARITGFPVVWDQAEGAGTR